MRRTKRVRRIAALLLIGVAWLFRDQFAAALEKDNQNLQAALTETYNQQQAEVQAGDQREMLSILRSIETRLRAQVGDADDSEEEEAARRSLHDEGRSLHGRAEALGKLAHRISADAPADRQITDAIANATAVAEKLMSNDVEPDRQLLDRWDDADTKLSASYQKLTSVAESELESAQAGADLSRGLAWLFTAIGGLLAGGWKTLLGGGESDAAPTGSGHDSNAATA